MADSHSYPFSAGSGATVSERDWSDMAQDWGHHSGVRPPSPLSEANPLRVTQRDASSVTVSPGRAKIAGYHYRLNSDEVVSLPNFNATNRERVDLVAPTVDSTQPIDPGSSTSLQVRSGSEATVGNAVAPAVGQLWDAHTNTPGLWDLPLARVRSVAGSPVYDSDGSTVLGYRPDIRSIEDQRRYLGNDVVYAANGSTMPINPGDGQLTWRADNRQLTVFDRPANRHATIAQVGAAIAYKPQVSGLSTGYTASGRYIMVSDKLCWVSIHITVSRRVTPNSADTVRLYLPIMPKGGHANPIPFHQYSGNDEGVNMMMGNALVRAAGYLHLVAPDPDDTVNNWEFDAMNRGNPGTCLLNRAGAYLTLAGIYETQ